MKKPTWNTSRLHPPSTWESLRDLLRTREQKLVRAGDDYPLLLLSFFADGRPAAESLSDAWSHVLPALPEAFSARYLAMLAHLPAIAVVELRRFNTCGCLGHFHPPGTESRLARRLAQDFGSTVVELDIAWQGVKEWQPNPLAAMATPVFGQLAAEQTKFQAALLSVLLHELEHAAFPDRDESEVRAASDRFYKETLLHLVEQRPLYE